MCVRGRERVCVSECACVHVCVGGGEGGNLCACVRMCVCACLPARVRAYICVAPNMNESCHTHTQTRASEQVATECL